MSAVDEILSQVDLDQLAQRVGAEPADVEQAARAALPALLGGLQANASDPAGSDCLQEALGLNDRSIVVGGVHRSQDDPDDGARIASHIFGSQQDQVVAQLGGIGGGKGLVGKLLPLLAPIVLSWLAKQVSGRAGGGATSGGSGGGLGDILGQVLGGAAQGSQTRGGIDTGSIISDVLGGLLGGGRR